MPNTKEEWEQIADDYFNKWQFPNCLGALDGKHVTIRSPKNSGSLNFNYKKTFSVVLMALADANYKLIYVDVGCKGRVSDGRVFNRSSLHAAIENNQLNIPPPRKLPSSNDEVPFVIIADDAFALKTYLMKPFSFRGQNRAEHIYNYRLSRARRMVESTFGLMANRFRVLRTIMELSEVNVNHCILAICALHNWLMTLEPSDPNQDTLTQDRETVDDNTAAIDRSALPEAKNVREILKNYFNSPAGAVSWQDDMV